MTDNEDKVTAAEAQKIRGHEAHRLIGLLAVGDMTHEELGIEFGKKTKSISNFSSNNRVLIAERRRQIGNELAGVWIVDKTKRIFERQDLVERLTGHFIAHEEAAAAVGETVDIDKLGRLADRIDKLMTSVAEELGHLPTRNPGEGPATVHLRHTVTGLDIQRDWMKVPDDASELMR